MWYGVSSKSDIERDTPDLLSQAHWVLIFSLKVVWSSVAGSAIPGTTNTKWAISSKSVFFHNKITEINGNAKKLQGSPWKSIGNLIIEVQRHVLEIHSQRVLYQGLWAGSIHS